MPRPSCGCMAFRTRFFLLLFIAKLYAQRGDFTLKDALEANAAKMIRRHPHVFGDAVVADAAAQTRAWEEHKRREKQGREDQSALAGVAAGLPEWMRALKLQKRAAAVGFDSEKSFARAFREWTGVAPSGFRTKGEGL